MISETVNGIVVFLFGFLLGALDGAMVFTGEAHGMEHGRPPQQPGESWWAWQRRIADAQAKQTSNLMAALPIFRFLLLSLAMLGFLMFVVVKYSPVGFRWLPFIGGVFVGIWLMQSAFAAAKKGRLKVRKTGLLDRLLHRGRPISSR
jgi:hypothetical protein